MTAFLEFSDDGDSDVIMEVNYFSTHWFTLSLMSLTETSVDVIVGEFKVNQEFGSTDKTELKIKNFEISILVKETKLVVLKKQKFD